MNEGEHPIRYVCPVGCWSESDAPWYNDKLGPAYMDDMGNGYWHCSKCDRMFGIFDPEVLDILYPPVVQNQGEKEKEGGR